MGDFYYELAIQIIDLCLSKRDRNGGLVELGELKRNLEKIRGSGGQEISEYVLNTMVEGGQCSS